MKLSMYKNCYSIVGDKKLTFKYKAKCLIGTIGFTLAYAGVGLMALYCLLGIIWNGSAEISQLTGQIIERNPYNTLFVSAIVSTVSGMGLIWLSIKK